MSVAAVYLYLFIKIIYCKISTSSVDIIIFIMILTQAQGRRQEIFSGGGGGIRFHRGAHFFMISETDIHQNNNSLYYYLNWSSSILKHI